MQETLYIGQGPLSFLQSGHSSPSHHQLPHRIVLNLIDSLKSLLLQRRYYFWEQPEVAGCPIWAVGGLSHLGDLIFCQKLCMRCDAGVGMLSWWSCQSPVAHSCGLLNHLNSFCGGMFKLNAIFDADLLLCLLNRLECNGHTLHMLTQWCLLPPLTSTVKLLLYMHVHSSPLSLVARLHWRCTNSSCYINNG